MSKAVYVPENNKEISGMKDEISLSPSSEKRESAIGIFSRLLRLDALGSKKNLPPESPTPVEPPVTYYGVYIPCEFKKGPDEEALHVYKNKSEALELVRRYKLARFKAFHNRQDAVSFALRGAEPVDVTDGCDNSVMGEKPYPFKAPSPQDMVSLRKAIEAGLATTVRDRVWDNPRYLVSSGNTPAIMQEGSRYNALHVAAKSMNAEMCNLVLTIVGNPAFVQTLYGMDADAECCKEFAAILLDRYLNTPDKAMNETPLHFAAKFGAEGAVDVLTSFPQCNRDAVNKFGEQPKDVICKRTSTCGPETARNIARMLHERYYVPVLHTEDDSLMPTIGQPFTPAVPPDLSCDPISPRYEIRAYAGPMEAAAAERFRRRWKTPPRRQPAPRAFRLRDLSKGLEAVGRNLAEQLEVGWKEYWPFLDTFTDLRSPEGLALLENYLKTKYEAACTFAYSDSCIETCADDFSLNVSKISLGNISQQTPSKDSTMSPISELCVAMKTCTISSDRPSHWKKTDPLRQRLLRQPIAAKSQNQSNGDIQSPPNHTVSQLLCIERTCQVFAKRIADALIFSLTAEPEVAGDSLKAESKHLQHTMYTYMDDERFQSIDFALIHSRLAQLVVYKLRQQKIELDDINLLVEFLVKLRCPNDDIFSSDDERKPNCRGVNRVRLSHVIDAHVRCLASFISEELTESDVTKGPSVSESECNLLWAKAAKCRCDWKLDLFERNSKKNTSFRKNRSMLSTSPKTESFVKRLVFDQEIGDGKTNEVGNLKENQVDSANSPGGDSMPTVFSVEMDKCQVIDAGLISEDDTDKSSEEEYQTASEREEAEDEMHDASDRAVAEAFIYCEEPTKMDRLVFDAVSECCITAEDYPNIYRWRHTIALYSPTEREKWRQAAPADESACAEAASSPRASPAGRARARRAERCSTPKRPDALADAGGRAVPLQVSNWLRVTGPNSPRSALATKNVGHNVSFGF